MSDVASKAGVHKSTVARALRNDPRVRPETRQKIAALAKAMDYRPEPALSLIAAKRWQTKSASSGLVLAYLHVGSKEIYRSGDAESLKKVAFGLGYGFEVFRTSEQSSGALSHILYSRGIPGLVLGPAHEPYDWEGLELERFSAVNRLSGHFSPPLHSVGEDFFQSVLQTYEHVREKGHRKIGFAVLAHAMEVDDDKLRLAAANYCRGLARRGCQVPVYAGGFHDIPRLVDWYERHRPEAVIGFNPIIRIWLEGVGYRCPQDFAFAALKGASVGADAGMDVAIANTAEATIELLDGLIRRGERGYPASPRKVLLEPRWVGGKTL